MSLSQRIRATWHRFVTLPRTRLGRLARRPASERRLLASTMALIATVRVAIWVLPFRIVRRLTVRWGRPRAVPASPRQDPQAIAWAVKAASRYVPGATCLTQALAAKVLLGRRGYPALLRIGVAKSADGRLEAHAWVEHDGEVVIGGTETHLKRYTSLPALADTLE